MPECNNCDKHVTEQFKKVFGVNGVVVGCPNCISYRELSNEEFDAGNDSRMKWEI